MIKKINLSAALLAAIISLISGCYQGRESQPFIESSSTWQIKGKRFLVGPNIEILMKVSNYKTRFYGNENLDYFGVSLWFDPKISGFKFNPSDTFLKLESSTNRPSQVGLVYSGGDTRSVGWDCGKYPDKDFGDGPNYKLFRGACFELYFSVKPPNSNTPFSLYIEGLSLNGAPVRIPEIKFREGTFRVFM